MRVQLLVVALSGTVLHSQLPAQACPKGTEYRAYNRGQLLSTITTRSFGDSIRATVLGNDGVSRIEWHARLAPNGLVQQVTWSQIPVREKNWLVPGTDVRASFSERQLVTTVTDDGRPARTRRAAVPAGTMPYMQQVPFLLDLLVRRARSIGGDDVRIPLAWIDDSGLQEIARLQRQGADSLVLSTTRGKVYLAMNKEGLVQEAYGPDGLLVLRSRCVD